MQDLYAIVQRALLVSCCLYACTIPRQFALHDDAKQGFKVTERKDIDVLFVKRLAPQIKKLISIMAANAYSKQRARI